MFKKKTNNLEIFRLNEITCQLPFFQCKIFPWRFTPWRNPSFWKGLVAFVQCTPPASICFLELLVKDVFDIVGVPFFNVKQALRVKTLMLVIITTVSVMKYFYLPQASHSKTICFQLEQYPNPLFFLLSEHGPWQWLLLQSLTFHHFPWRQLVLPENRS